MPNPLEQSSGDASTQPITLNNFRDLTTIISIHGTLVRLEEKVHTLEVASKSNGEKIDNLTKESYAILRLKQDVEQAQKHLSDVNSRHATLEMNLEKRVNSLGERLGTQVNGLATRLDNKIHELEKFDNVAKTMGWAAISLAGTAVTVLGYFAHFLLSHIVFKP